MGTNPPFTMAPEVRGTPCKCESGVGDFFCRIPWIKIQAEFHRGKKEGQEERREGKKGGNKENETVFSLLGTNPRDTVITIVN